MGKSNCTCISQDAQTVSAMHQPYDVSIGTATHDSEVMLYYNKSHTFKHLAGARNAALVFQHGLKLNKEKERKEERKNEG